MNIEGEKMSGIIAVAVTATWLWCLKLGFDGNYGLLMMGKVWAWVGVVCGFFSAAEKMKSVIQEKPLWRFCFSVVTTVGAAVWLSYHGHWVTGSALLLSEVVFMAAYLDRDNV
jgi:hypothetical protein